MPEAAKLFEAADTWFDDAAAPVCLGVELHLQGFDGGGKNAVATPVGEVSMHTLKRAEPLWKVASEGNEPRI